MAARRILNGTCPASSTTHCKQTAAEPANRTTTRPLRPVDSRIGDSPRGGSRLAEFHGGGRDGLAVARGYEPERRVRPAWPQDHGYHLPVAGVDGLHQVRR